MFTQEAFGLEAVPAESVVLTVRLHLEWKGGPWSVGPLGEGIAEALGHLEVVSGLQVFILDWSYMCTGGGVDCLTSAFLEEESRVLQAPAVSIAQEKLGDVDWMRAAGSISLKKIATCSFYIAVASGERSGDTESVEWKAVLQHPSESTWES
ncbi:hypothetical protein DV515_00015151 [Chloebia gouldiae]|uniref:Uncharacterized protein n=1 Tax=Chloebia gouldiae TaxID=44316 RepID=A0A3L8RWM5_CHLGU|nr:hypothetical protein DV515_00015151 [Chloebia gouldiae]